MVRIRDLNMDRFLKTRSGSEMFEQAVAEVEVRKLNSADAMKRKAQS